MKYKVIRSQTIDTGIGQLDQFVNALSAEAYPKPGEIFEGRMQVDSNGNKTVCGTKNLLGVEYPFCFSRANVEPLIAGIPINTVSLIIAGVLVLLGVRALNKKK